MKDGSYYLEYANDIESNSLYVIPMSTNYEAISYTKQKNSILE